MSWVGGEGGGGDRRSHTCTWNVSHYFLGTSIGVKCEDFLGLVLFLVCVKSGSGKINNDVILGSAEVCSYWLALS